MEEVLEFLSLVVVGDIHERHKVAIRVHVAPMLSGSGERIHIVCQFIPVAKTIAVCIPVERICAENHFLVVGNAVLIRIAFYAAFHIGVVQTGDLAGSNRDTPAVAVGNIKSIAR